MFQFEIRYRLEHDPSLWTMYTTADTYEEAEQKLRKSTSNNIKELIYIKKLDD